MKLCMTFTPINVTDASKHSSFYSFHYIDKLRTRVSVIRLDSHGLQTSVLDNVIHRTWPQKCFPGAVETGAYWI